MKITRFNKALSHLFVLILSTSLALYPAIAFAESGSMHKDHTSAETSYDMSDEINPLIDVIKKHILKNIITVAALIGFIICAISAIGGNVSQLAINNMGYVLFLVFGSTIMIKFVEHFNTVGNL